VLRGAVVLVAVVAGAGLVALWPSGDAPTIDEEFFGERVDATVTDVVTGPCSFSSPAAPEECDLVVFDVTSGSTAGAATTIEVPLAGGGVRLEEGDDVVLSYAEGAPAEVAYQFADFQRRTPMVWLVVLFVVAVVALGRWRGALALAGLGVSLLVLVGFMLPSLLDGNSPVAVALTAAAVIALVALYLAHGTGDHTTVAVLGTVTSLAITGVLAVVFVGATRLTGLAAEEVGFLRAFGGDLDFEGLLLAGIIIGALGVLDDVTVTQVSAVAELHASDPAMPTGRLYRAAIRVGRDHIASTVNTLVLAYAGASLPLLLLFSQSDQPAGDVLTTETVAVEVVRTLVGSIGLVASVPITTLLAVLVAKGSLTGLRSRAPAAAEAHGAPS
jgi:uncharacterized membrane protein